MKSAIHHLLVLIIVVLLPGISGAQERTAVAGAQSVGLVLSGGGAKGIAHIGVIQALEDNDIPIDYITGTSMGSIIGGLYACGYTPQEMLDLILSKGFSYWSTGKTDPALVFYFNRETPSPSIYSLPLGKKSAAADSVPASLISGQPMSFAFLDLFAKYTAQCSGNFDRLFVPFRCVASDVAAKHKHVFSNGRVGDAIRASMSFPIVFQPIEINGTLYYDGGIYDNFPVDVMKKTFAPSIMIGVDVSTEDIGPQTTLLDQIENLVIQNNNYDLPQSEGLRLKIDLNEFGLLDFPAAQAIYKVGYDHAMAHMDSIKARVTSRRPHAVTEARRAAFKAQTPRLVFDSVSVSGGTKAQNDYIKYLFTPSKGSDTLNVDEARLAFYRAMASGKLADLFPQAAYNESTGMFGLSLRASVKNRYRANIGGFISSSTNSFLYFSADYSTLSAGSVNTSLSAWVGQSTMAGVLRGRMFLHTPVPTSIGLEAVASRERFYEKDRAFFNASEPTFLVSHEYFGRLNFSIAARSTGRVDKQYKYIKSIERAT